MEEAYGTNTSGLYSNMSWSPQRKSSFGKSCMFSQIFSTKSIGSVCQKCNNMTGNVNNAPNLYYFSHFTTKDTNTQKAKKLYLLLIVKLIGIYLLNFFIYPGTEYRVNKSYMLK